MEWLDKFLVSFGMPESGNGQYLYRDQRDIVRDHDQKMFDGSDIQQRDITQNDVEEKTELGRSQDSGEQFEVSVKALRPKDPSELEWIDREMVISFSSVDNKDKIIISTLSRLCDGKYASFKSLPVEEVAERLATQCDEVFAFAEASMAIYSDVIDPKHAFRIAKSVSDNNIISYLDYEKIKSKLPGNLEKDFDGLLAEARIKVSYPLNHKKS